MVSVFVSENKREQYTIQKGFTKWTKYFKTHSFSAYKDQYSLSKLNESKLLILPLPKEKFTLEEFDELKAYLENGGSILYLCACEEQVSNINYLLEEYGILLHSDSVIKTSFTKYHHPKRVLVEKRGIMNRAFNHMTGKNDLQFLYPFGCSITCQKPSIPLLSTGTKSYPAQRPILVIHDLQNGGQLAVCGSFWMFHDDYLEKEDNKLIFNTLLEILTCERKPQWNQLDFEDPDLLDYYRLPNTIKLSSKPRSSLMGHDELPNELENLFQSKTFEFSSQIIPDSIHLYEKLGIPRAPLSLIPPVFSNSYPKFQPSIFPPQLRDPPGPALELFDLDQLLASEEEALMDCMQKFDGQNLEGFIRECGRKIGFPSGLEAKEILARVTKQLMIWKMLNADHFKKQ